MAKPLPAFLAAAVTLACAGQASATAIYDFHLTGTIVGGGGADPTIGVGTTVTMTASIPADLVVSWNIPGYMVTSAIGSRYGALPLDPPIQWRITAGGYSWTPVDDEFDGLDQFFTYDTLALLMTLAGPSITFDGDKIVSVGGPPLFPASGSTPELDLGPTPQGYFRTTLCCSSSYSAIPVNTGFTIHDTDLYGNTSVPQNFFGVWDYADSSVVLTGIPEPAAWTLMIFGLFALGSVLRHAPKAAAGRGGRDRRGLLL